VVRSLLDAGRTHGHWPWAAAGLAPLTTALAWRERERLADGDAWVFWLPVPALLWHQTEEWFLPGGFLPWFNREVLGSDEDEFPITRALGLGINVGLGWGGVLAAGLAGPRAPGLAAWVHAMNLGNLAVHAGAAARERRWNPGLATATGMFAPLAVVALGRLARGHRGDVALGVAAGAAMSAGTFLGMRRRAAVRSR
jgi:Protein of unknown function with HXXEE motif